MPRSYNLPGFGNINYHLFPHAESVYALLDRAGLVQRLADTNQLGALREVLPGAHHTRFEYVIAQLALITELCYLKGQQPAGFSLGKNRGTFGTIPAAGKEPTNGEILQILAFLTNIGHSPSTFSGSRALVHFLRSDRHARRKFRSGLPAEDRLWCDDLLDRCNIYAFPNIVGQFLMERLRGYAGGHDVADFAQAIMRRYAQSSKEEDQALAALWRLFKSIRRLTYVALDSLYTPVPFSLDLAPIFLSLETYLEDVFAFESTFQGALERLEGVMRDSVYLAPPSLLQHARAAEFAVRGLSSNKDSFDGLRGIFEVVGPTALNKKVFDWERGDLAVQKESCVAVDYACDPELSHKLIEDTVTWESDARSRIGTRSAYVGAEWDPPRRLLKVVVGLRQREPQEMMQAALRSTMVLAKLDLQVRDVVDVGPQVRWANGQALLRFILKAFFGWDLLLRFRAAPVTKDSPLFIGVGTTKIAGMVDSYLEGVRSALDADSCHEIELLSRTLRRIPYRGLALAFAGSTEIMSKEKQIAEFDGVVVLLGGGVSEGPIIIVEGKNMAFGATEAKRQLARRLEELAVGESRRSIIGVDNAGAYAQLRTA